MHKITPSPVIQNILKSFVSNCGMWAVGTILPIIDILPYVRQIAFALQYAHDNKVLHGNIRPEKIFLTQDNNILLDFFDNVIDEIGFSKLADRNEIAYQSPDNILTQAGDQYSLGIVVYEWLEGQLPFNGSNVEEMMFASFKTPPPSLREKVPSISPAIEQVVMKALSKDPKDRYESVQAFADALEQAVLIGQQLGGYRLTQQLGGGSIGNVYRGEHVDLGTKAAIKVLRSHIDEVSFQNGVRRIARLIHPNIVRTVESGVKDNMFFLVMDYVPHGTLKQRHSNDKTLPLTTVVEYVKQVAAALQEAHDHNVFLGNIRPGNMLVGDNNEVLLSGFDIVLMDSAKGGNISIGQYTAPEQAKGVVLPASDQYALAAIVYEWLSGKPPLAFSPSESENDKAKRLAETLPPPLQTLVPTLSKEGEDVVMKALAKDSKQRFVSVEDFARALEEAIMPRSKLKMPDRVGQTFGNYRLIRLLGKGGFADVYLGRHIQMGTFAAVKVLHTQLTGEYAEHFRNEARTIANLRHPAIVRVLNFGIEGDTPFLVMDRAKETLRDRHPKGSVLPPRVIIPYVKQVATALQYAHDQRRIHRDVKPENMLIGLREDIWLSDFGIATIVNTATVQKTESIAGTAMYMAPEQFKGKARFASDQYSLAVVVYEWLCGEPPFMEGNFIQLGFQHNSDPPPSLHGKVPSISADVEKVVMIALAKNPDQRFSSIQAFANALEQACK